MPVKLIIVSIIFSSNQVADATSSAIV